MGEKDSWRESPAGERPSVLYRAGFVFWRGLGLSMSPRQDRQLVVQAVVMAVLLAMG
jgi:hypothetical protein